MPLTGLTGIMNSYVTRGNEEAHWVAHLSIEVRGLYICISINITQCQVSSTLGQHVLSFQRLISSSFYKLKILKPL